MNAKRKTVVAGLFAGLALCAGLSQAAITVDGSFRLGEDDPGATAAQAGQNPTRSTSTLTALSIGAGPRPMPLPHPPPQSHTRVPPSPCASTE